MLGESGLIYSKCLKKKKKNCQPRILYPAKLSFRNEGKIDFPRQTKAEEIITTRTALQEILKGVLQNERKRC